MIQNFLAYIILSINLPVIILDKSNFILIYYSKLINFLNFICRVIMVMDETIETDETIGDCARAYSERFVTSDPPEIRSELFRFICSTFTSPLPFILPYS